MEIQAALKLARRLKNKQWRLWTWKAVMNKHKAKFGFCNPEKKQIELSEYLVPYMTDKAVRDVIIHEIAHALTSGYKHDEVWRRKCIALGGSGETTGDYNHFIGGEKSGQIIEEKMAKYILVCPVCGNRIFRMRKLSVDLSCEKHGKIYDDKYKYIVVKKY